MRTVLCLFIVCCTLGCAETLCAQDSVPGDSTDSEPLVRVSGSASVTSDFYELTSDPSIAQKGRRPAVLHRLVFAPTITIAGIVTLPLNVMITYPETNTTTPSITAPSLMELFTNPANALGLSSFSPKIGWAQLHLGSHTPQLSELSGGDLQLFGVGVDLTPGIFQASASRGIIQRAVEPDASRGINGAYRRTMTMGRIAVGNPDTTSVGVNLVYASDDPTSLRSSIVSIVPSGPFEGDPSVILPADTIRLRAEEGAIASVDMKTRIADGVTIAAEGAISAFTRDIGSNVLDPSDNPLSGLFTARTSTRFDGAANATLAFRYASWGISLSGLYMGAGFQPLGYPFQQTDRMDLKVSPMLNLLNGDLTFSGTIGQRVNNLSETKGERLTQTIANGQLAVRFSEVLSITSTYSNFGIRNNRQDAFDSARVQNVSETFSIDPMIVFSAAEMMHTFNVGLSIDRYDDFNLVSGVASSNNTRSALLTYTGVFQTMPLTVGLTASLLENALSIGTLTVSSMGVNASYRMLSGALTPTISLTRSQSAFARDATDTQTFVKTGLRWKPVKTMTMAVNYGINAYSYGDTATRGTGFTEHMLQLSLSTTF
ncbi:MAG: hypothetical protein RL594_326 [Bacteroidota bacterium]|jgi:hypothetical protein